LGDGDQAGDADGRKERRWEPAAAAAVDEKPGAEAEDGEDAGVGEGREEEGAHYARLSMIG
jgi:hypothetical protein